MGFFSYLFWGGLAVYGLRKVRQANEEEQRQNEIKRCQEEKRKSCVYPFNEGLSENEFKSIVYSCAKKIKRIEGIVIDGLEISCLVSSQSGITQWTFTLDYNDYGRLTGDCFFSTDNNDSNIPKRLNDLIYAKLEPYIDSFQPKEKVKSEPAKSLHKNKKTKKKSKKWFIVFATVMLVSVLSFVGYYEYQKLLPIGYSDSDLEGLKYSEVVEKLEAAGFTNVIQKEVSDLPVCREDETNVVTKVNIGSSTVFSPSKKYPSNLWIAVEYHTVKTYNPTFTSKEAKGMNYLNVKKAFEDDGFTNVKLVPEYDVIAGWIAKDGEVKSVSINGEEKYDEYADFRPDAEIVVAYHALRSNKPKK